MDLKIFIEIAIPMLSAYLTLDVEAVRFKKNHLLEKSDEHVNVYI